MSTIAELINDIGFRMHSYTQIREQVTFLTSGIGTSDTSLQVDSGARVTRGLIEIDDELLLVNTVDADTVSLFPFGRAQEGSVAATHAMNAKVVNDPLFPRAGILSSLQDTILQVCPDLFQVKTTEITFNASVYTYALPSDLDRVLRVTASLPGPTGFWPQVRFWDYDSEANTTAYPSGKAINLYEAITPGQKYRITYAAPYTLPAATSDTLSSLGIQDTVREVLVLGTCWRLTQNLEPARLQLQGAEQFARQAAVPAGAESNLAKQFYAMFAQRKAEERTRLLTLHKPQIHRTR